MRQSGLTLIELMIVTAIIAILAMVSIPLYLGYLQSSRDNAAQQNMETLALAEENYFYEYNTYLAGTYGAGVSDTLSTALGWEPKGDGGELTYTVAPCAPGISRCMSITVTGTDGHTSATATRSHP